MDNPPEFALKPAVAAAVLACLWIAESWIPFYTDHVRRSSRLVHDARNLALGFLNAAILAVFFSSSLDVVSTWSEANRCGLLHLVSWPAWLETLAGFVLFDFWMYLWHRANHSIPLLWRFHRTHHSDAEMDASTGVRFHVGEVVLSAGARLVILPLIGMALGQLVIYELVFLPVVLLHHSNVRLPRWLDYGLLALIVTPAMHRVHHSRWRPETDSNYGSVFPYWDVLLRTFRLRPDARTIHLGLDELDDERWQTLWGLLQTPFACSIVRSTTEANACPHSDRVVEPCRTDF